MTKNSRQKTVDGPYNKILAALPHDELKKIQPHLTAVDLAFKLALVESNRHLQHVYFVHSGVASVVSPIEDGIPVEIATIGPEGMVGVEAMLADRSMSYRTFMQVPGYGERMEVGQFRRLLKSCPRLNQLLMRYTLALMNQIAQNAACNRAHPVDERCARWLLMTQDRVSRPSFTLTQEFLAQMLGVRRPTVSIAASMLARAGLISYVRGEITIRDRAGLEAAACECYRIITEQFDDLGNTAAAAQ